MLGELISEFKVRDGIIKTWRREGGTGDGRCSGRGMRVGANARMKGKLGMIYLKLA